MVCWYPSLHLLFYWPAVCSVAFLTVDPACTQGIHVLMYVEGQNMIMVVNKGHFATVCICICTCTYVRMEWIGTTLYPTMKLTSTHPEVGMLALSLACNASLYSDTNSELYREQHTTLNLMNNSWMMTSPLPRMVQHCTCSVYVSTGKCPPAVQWPCQWTRDKYIVYYQVPRAFLQDKEDVICHAGCHAVCITAVHANSLHVNAMMSQWCHT